MSTHKQSGKPQESRLWTILPIASPDNIVLCLAPMFILGLGSDASLDGGLLTAGQASIWATNASVPTL
jgi:hypothetical protein